MDFMAIFALIQRGLVVIGTLVEAGQSAAPALEALKNLATGAQDGTVTDEQMAETEALLDQLITQFNEPFQDE